MTRVTVGRFWALYLEKQLPPYFFGGCSFCNQRWRCFCLLDWKGRSKNPICCNHGGVVILMQWLNEWLGWMSWCWPLVEHWMERSFLWPLVRSYRLDTLNSKMRWCAKNSHPPWSHPKKKLVFQPSIFRCYVSFREGRPPTTTLKISWKDRTSTKTSKVLWSSRQSLHGESGDLPVHRAVGDILKFALQKHEKTSQGALQHFCSFHSTHLVGLVFKGEGLWIFPPIFDLCYSASYLGGFGVRDVPLDIAPEEWTFWKRSFPFRMGCNLLMSVPKHDVCGTPKGWAPFHTRHTSHYHSHFFKRKGLVMWEVDEKFIGWVNLLKPVVGAVDSQGPHATLCAARVTWWTKVKQVIQINHKKLRDCRLQLCTTELLCLMIIYIVYNYSIYCTYFNIYILNFIFVHIYIWGI